MTAPSSSSLSPAPPSQHSSQRRSAALGRHPRLTEDDDDEDAGNSERRARIDWKGSKVRGLSMSLSATRRMAETGTEEVLPKSTKNTVRWSDDGVGVDLVSSGEPKGVIVIYVHRYSFNFRESCPISIIDPDESIAPCVFMMRNNQNPFFNGGQKYSESNTHNASYYLKHHDHPPSTTTALYHF